MLNDAASELADFGIGIVWVNGPYGVADKASALRAGKRAPR